MKREPKLGDLRVWWIPQIPMKPFLVPVDSYAVARKITKTLAAYDLFQFENKVKPDYSNAGGVEYFDGEDWLSVDDEEEFEEIMREMRR